MSAPTFVGMKPVLSFTSHMAPRAGERQKRRRRKVKTPVNPRVRSIDLSGRIAQENRDSQYFVKWVSGAKWPKDFGWIYNVQPT